MLVVAALTAAGCSTYGELRSVVEDATPDGADRIGECQEFGLYGFVEDPAYGCAFFVPGTRAGVAADVARRLVRAGFETRCNDDPLDGTIELNAKRGKILVYGRVSRRASVITMSGDQALNIHTDRRSIQSEYRAAPSRHVILKLDAGEYDARSLRPDWPSCPEFLRMR